MKRFAIGVLVLLIATLSAGAASTLALDPNPLVVDRAVVYELRNRWMIHVKGEKTRDCGTPELYIWQRGEDVSFDNPLSLGTNSNVGPIDHAWPTPVKEIEGVWHMEYALRWKCPEGYRVSAFKSEEFTIE